MFGALEAHAEAPDVIFLRRTVEFHSENVLVSVHELREERFAGHAVFVYQSEVSVIEEGDNLVALFGCADEDFGNLLGFFFGSGVAGRVVREVQEENFLKVL